MTLAELIALFEASHRRYRLVGTAEAGAVIGLDLEGRIFAVLDGDVLNRVNRAAFLGTCTRETYLNPGGDGLWPAPEGSTLGYEYSTGSWRVPPGLTSARFWVMCTEPDRAAVRAEIDLINSGGLGIPVAFERHVRTEPVSSGVVLRVAEVIEYLGARPLAVSEARLAPWSLCQFDCGEGCDVRFPDCGPGTLWDLYDPSDSARRCEDGVWYTRTAGGPRYQLGLGAGVDWIEFRDPRRGLTVRRTAALPPPGQEFIDIADRDPGEAPSGPAARFSVYSDPTCFMEIEAAGGCPEIIEPGTRLTVDIVTQYGITPKGE